MVRGSGEVTPARLDALFEAKARAELAHADRLGSAPGALASAGDPMASVVLVFGTPDGAQRKAGKALAGPVGDAAVKAVTALGFDPAALFAICSRPEPGIDAVALASRLELAIEAVDPVVVIALDEDASRDLSAAFGCAALAPGRPATVRGRTLGAVGDLRGSLHNAAAKRPVWAAFRAVHAAVPESLRPAAPSGSSPG